MKRSGDSQVGIGLILFATLPMIGIVIMLCLLITGTVRPAWVEWQFKSEQERERAVFETIQKGLESEQERERAVFETIQKGLESDLVPTKTPLRMSDYEKLIDGMSYLDVVSLLGPGTEVTRNNIGGIASVSYQWINDDGSGIMAIFQNDKLVSKAQFGLK